MVPVKNFKLVVEKIRHDELGKQGNKEINQFILKAITDKQTQVV